MGKRKTSEIYCYESRTDGTLTLYIDSDTVFDKNTDSTRVVLDAKDIKHLMYAAVDALQKKAVRR